MKKKISIGEIPSKIYSILPKDDNIKKIRNNSSQNVLKTFKRSKSSIKSNNKSDKSILNSLKDSSEIKILKKNKFDIDSQAFQSLNEAALNIKHLLSDFLINIDPEDKEIFQIDKELKRIKKNDLKNSNIFSLLSGNDSDRDNKSVIKSKIKYENEENKIGIKNIKSLKKKNGKLLDFNFETNQYWLNDFPKKIRTMKTSKNKPNIDEFYDNEIKKNKKISEKSINNNYSFLKKKNIFIKQNNNKKLLNKERFSLKSLINLNNKNDNLDDSNTKLLFNENVSNNKKIDEIRKNTKNIFENLNQENLIKKTNTFTFFKNNTNKKLKDNIINSSSDDSESENDIQLKDDIQNKFPTTIINQIDKNDKNNIKSYINNKMIIKFNNICEGFKKSLSIYSNEENEIEGTQKKFKNTLSENKIFQEDLEKNNNIINDINNNKEIHEIQFRRLIKKKNYVYDSLSDEELLDETEEGEFFINPNGIFLILFDMILFFFSIYAIIFSPIDFAFTIDKIPNLLSKSSFMDFTIDLFFFIDLFIGFFTAYYNFDEQLITNNKLIIKNYLKGWFFINLISGIPLNSIFKIMDYYKKNNSIIYSFTNEKWKVFQLFQLIRLFKLFKTFTHNSFIQLIHKKMKGIDDLLLKWFILYMSLFLFFVIVHLLSCIFIFLSQLDFPNWISVNQLQFQKNKIDIYITSLYYICATVFTIGYGDIISISLYERIFNLILLVVGIIIYSFFVSALSNYVQNIDSKVLEYRNKIEILQNIKVNYEEMPQELFNKISQFLLYNFYNKKKDKHEIIDNLPLSLRNKLIKEMYKDIINNFIFFKNFNNTDFIIKVVLSLKPIQVHKNERLVNEGDYIEEIIFVKKGKLSLEIPIPVIINKDTIKKIQLRRNTQTSLKYNLTKNILNFENISNNRIPNVIDIPTEKEKKQDHFFQNFEKEIIPQKQYIKIIEIRKNEHFGDILMFLNKKSPLRVRVKSKICELFLLKKTEAVDISMNFPKIWRKIIKKSLFNMEQIERLINKTLKLFLIYNEGKNINNEDIDEIHYFQIDPKNINKLLNANNMIYNFKNNQEQCELKSIPSEENEDEEIEDEEKEEEEEENKKEENNKKGNITKITSIKKKKNEKIKTIKEVDENNLDSKSLKSENSQSSKKSNYESQLNSSDSDSKSSKKTIITNPGNKFIDYISEKNSNQKESLISTGYFYLEDEINNESLPFDEPIEINKSEIISEIIPKEINKCSNFNNHIILNDNESLKNIKKKFPNSILMLLNYDFQNNSNKNNNINENNIIIKKSSFDFLTIVKIENFSLISIEKKNFEYYQKKFQNKINLSENKLKSSKSFMETTRIHSFLDKFNSFNNSPINKRKLSKMMNLHIEKIKNNSDNLSQLESPLNSNNNNDISIMEMMKTMKSPKSSIKDKRNSSLKKNTGKKLILNSNSLNKEKKFKSSCSLKKLDLISNNIKKNSYNLNNPNSFYSDYFISISSNQSNNNFSSKIKNIAKIIEGQKKRESKENLTIDDDSKSIQNEKT